MLSLVSGMLAPLAQAAPAYAGATSASFTAGGVLVGGTRYAKNDHGLTLTVTTDDKAKCVTIAGAHTATQTASPARSNWTFLLTAGTGDGGKTVTASAFQNPGNCSNPIGSPSTANASYTLDNTAPTLTGAATTPANTNGWYKGDVVIDWTCSDSGSGIASDGSCPGDSTIIGQGSNLSASASVSDKAGNTKNTIVNDIKID